MTLANAPMGTSARRLQERVAIVTGASHGIGLAIASQLIGEGAKVVITARKAAALAEAVAYLGGESHAIGLAGHAAESSHQRDVIDKTLSTFGRLDFLVNNVGINPAYGTLAELDLDAARKIVEVNCISMLSWVQQLLKTGFAERGGGIVNISSSAALKPAPGVGFYGASKSMLSYLTAQLAMELAPAIRVNGIAPAIVKSRFSRPLYEGREEQMAALYPLARLGLPEDVAKMTAFLLSDDSSWVTGQTMVLDGGWALVGHK